jgi:phosphatidylserine/phosphatidylglycerophosphate/cardiolipin synthase-like enzyme
MSLRPLASNDLYLLDKQGDIAEHLIKVLNKANHRIYIFSRRLNPLFFNNESVADALSKTARSSRRSDIRILVERPQSIAEVNHKILKLSQRLPSKIAIQKITVEPQDDYEFVIIDNDKIWLQHQEDIYTGFTNYNARPEVKRFEVVFNDLWKNSTEDVRLRRLSL